ncbi:TrmH family RNA methyltransferase [Patescibacteria group bacterium]|nr:TrmH family RNA methyltransferase [Patescibacteria group bacterium]
MIVILHNIRSNHNVGSIFRTADGAGIEKIYLTGITPSLIDRFGRQNRALSKVSLNAEDYIKWEYTKSAAKLLDKLKAQGYMILALEQNKLSKPLFKLKLAKNSKIALIVGNEIKGLPKTILERSDKILEIPMCGKKESLNVSVAFGIAAYQLI